MSERVKHPNHYNRGIEMWDYAHSHNLDFFEGNIVKYVTRWKEKNGMEDLHKAKQYLDKLIDLVGKKDNPHYKVNSNYLDLQEEMGK
tara:strand:- start:10611 stop:10871 length:261 start_codon:yes stop_codon:yes gene_type:complete